MEAECSFFYRYFRRPDATLYNCHVTSAKINEAGTVISAFNGTHRDDKRCEDVEAIVFWRANMRYFPRGLAGIFPRLRVLHIIGCGLETLSREDFIGLRHLEKLMIKENQLKILPSDLFVGMPKLTFLDVDHMNQIEFMSSDLLKPIMSNNVKFIYFGGNEKKNIRKFCYHPEMGRGESSIENLMRFIDANFIEPPDYSSNYLPQDFSYKTKESLTVVDHLWESKEFADFTIIVGSNQFRVHKFVLANQSSKFDEMFEDQADQEVHEMTTVKNAEIVEELLKFFYTRKMSPSADFIELLKLSSEYECAEAKAFCRQMLPSGLQEPNRSTRPSTFIQSIKLNFTKCWK